MSACQCYRGSTVRPNYPFFLSFLSFYGSFRFLLWFFLVFGAAAKNIRILRVRLLKTLEAGPRFCPYICMYVCVCICVFFCCFFFFSVLGAFFAAQIYATFVAASFYWRTFTFMTFLARHGPLCHPFWPALRRFNVNSSQLSEREMGICGEKERASQEQCACCSCNRRTMMIHKNATAGERRL